MIKLVKKRVLGSSKLPKFNAYPPMIVVETEDYFKQLKNLGFTIQDIEEESKPKVSKKEETKKVEEEILKEEPKEEVVDESTEEVVEEKTARVGRGIRKTTKK